MNAPKKLLTMSQLTEDLANTYVNLKSGKVPPEKAIVIAKVAGRIIHSCKTQLEYNQYMRRRTKIKFLESGR